MKSVRTHALIQALACCLFLAGCNQPKDAASYSFFVAGHTYGASGVNNEGFHPAFKNKFGYLQSRPEVAFGVLTGDIVTPNPTAIDWDEIDADIDTLGLPVHFAVGNHDMQDRALFESRYGTTYFSYEHEQDLFIVLDPNIDGWNISGEQLDFLTQLLTARAPNCKNIFVFFHQILWAVGDEQFDHIRWNSDAGKAPVVNFWTEVVPLFTKLPNEVVMFSGDLGAPWASTVTYDLHHNITLIASGMGGHDGDHFVIANVAADKSISYELICLLSNETHCLGQLTDRLTVQHP